MVAKLEKRPAGDASLFSVRISASDGDHRPVLRGEVFQGGSKQQLASVGLSMAYAALHLQQFAAMFTIWKIDPPTATL
jgi:hypothetical protein